MFRICSDDKERGARLASLLGTAFDQLIACLTPLGHNLPLQKLGETILGAAVEARTINSVGSVTWGDAGSSPAISANSVLTADLPI